MDDEEFNKKLNALLKFMGEIDREVMEEIKKEKSQKLENKTKET